MRFLLPLLVGLSVSLGNTPGSSAFCSLDVAPSFLEANSIVFIGVATGDSAAGNFYMRRWNPLDGELPDSTGGNRFAQLFEVERFAARVPDSVRKLIRAAGNRVAVVPWVTLPDCSRQPMIGSALWTQPGTRGVFAYRLQPRNRWVKGIPTFYGLWDLYEPYPSATDYQYRQKRERIMSIEQLMAFVDSIPPIRTDTTGRSVRDPMRMKSLLSWAANHPDLAGLYPASQFIRGASYFEWIGGRDTLVSPVSGTWRFVLEIGNDAPLVFFGRTTQLTSSLMTNEFSGNTLRGSKPFGYDLYMLVATDVDSLRSDRNFFSPKESFDAPQGFLGASFDSTFNADGTVEWKASADIMRAASMILTDSTVKKRLLALNQFSRRFPRGSSRSFTPGKIVRSRDGRMRLLEIRSEDSVRITGERISTKPLKEH